MRKLINCPNLCLTSFINGSHNTMHSEWFLALNMSDSGSGSFSSIHILLMLRLHKPACKNPFCVKFRKILKMYARHVCNAVRVHFNFIWSGSIRRSFGLVDRVTPRNVIHVMNQTILVRFDSPSSPPPAGRWHTFWRIVMQRHSYHLCLWYKSRTSNTEIEIF